MYVELERFAYLPTGTLGQLTAGDFQCFTLERPWQDNAINVSCIPEAVYQCGPFNGKKFKDVVEVIDVPDRSYILFHSANYPQQLHGCIAPGIYFHINDDEPRVFQSRKALRMFFDAAGKSFELKITHKEANLPYL